MWLLSLIIYRYCFLYNKNIPQVSRCAMWITIITITPALWKTNVKLLPFNVRPTVFKQMDARHIPSFPFKPTEAWERKILSILIYSWHSLELFDLWSANTTVNISSNTWFKTFYIFGQYKDCNISRHKSKLFLVFYTKWLVLVLNQKKILSFTPFLQV